MSFGVESRDLLGRRLTLINFSVPIRARGKLSHVYLWYPGWIANWIAGSCGWSGVGKLGRGLSRMVHQSAELQASKMNFVAKRPR